MAVIAVTGHRNLSPATSARVTATIRSILARERPPLVGVSCLADGADQIFAEEVVAAGGVLRVLLPAADYRDTIAAAGCYDALLRAAAEVRTLPYAHAGPLAYRAAAWELLRGADRLIAVWDGGPPLGPGGTAEVVAAARSTGMDVRVVWPKGGTRIHPNSPDHRPVTTP